MELPIHNMVCSRRKGGECQGKPAPSLKPVVVEGVLLGYVSWGSAWLGLCLLSELGDAMERVGEANENRPWKLLPGLTAAVSLSVGAPGAAT